MVWGPGGVSRAQSAKAETIELSLVTAATTPSCTIEVTCNQISVLRGHKRTNDLDDFLGNTSFLGVDIVDV